MKRKKVLTKEEREAKNLARNLKNMAKNQFKHKKRISKNQKTFSEKDIKNYFKYCADHTKTIEP